MSLVGTRPPTLDEWEKYEPHHRARMSFRPGLTGLWQVSGRSNITDFEEVVKLDTQYIGEWSVKGDVSILFKTVMEYFKLSNDVTIPAIGMGTGWMNTAYKNPKFFTKRVLKELVERISGKYSKDKNYNASYELRKLIKFGKSIKDDVACGYELFDTAYSYNNCEIMGDKLKLSNNRKRYFIISKCSN